MNNDRGRFAESTDYINNEAVLNEVKKATRQLLLLWAKANPMRFPILKEALLKPLEFNSEILLKLPNAIQKQINEAKNLLPNLDSKSANEKVLDAVRLALQDVISELEDLPNYQNITNNIKKEEKHLTHENEHNVTDNSTIQVILTLMKDPHLLEGLSKLQEDEFKEFSKVVDEAKERRQKAHNSPILNLGTHKI